VDFSVFVPKHRDGGILLSTTKTPKHQIAPKSLINQYYHTDFQYIKTYLFKCETLVNNTKQFEKGI
jgi:hypothetical protein